MISSTSSSIRYPFKWVLLLLTVVALCGLLIGQSFLDLRTQPVSPTQDVTVLANGQVMQSGQKVGYFYGRADGTLELDLPFFKESIFRSNSAQLHLILPAPISSQDLKLRISSIQGLNGLSLTQIDSKTVNVVLTNVVPDSHTTVILQVPASYLHLPLIVSAISLLENLTLTQWLVLSLILLLLASLSLLLTEYKKPLKAKGERTVPPDLLKPIQMAVLMKSKIAPEHISSLLYDFANRGMVEIIQNQEDTYFLRTAKQIPLESYEQFAFELLIPSQHSSGSLKNTLRVLDKSIFSKAVDKIYIAVYNSLTDQAFFQTDLRTVHLRFKTIGITVQFFWLLEIIISYFVLSTHIPGLVILGMCGYLFGYLIYQVGYHYIPLSKAGVAKTIECQQFINFLINPVPFSPDTLEGNVLFYHYLPYALALKKEQEWMNRFKYVNFIIPTWFNSEEGDIFTPISFIAHVQAVTDAVADVFVQVKDPNVD